MLRQQQMSTPVSNSFERGGSEFYDNRKVEAVLYQHSAVGEVGVVGRPDHVWGEVVVAFVALRSGQAVRKAFTAH
jgi:acyl-CoA synthetase (AMP-forming)/AMP-acid ligase II